MIDAFHEQDLIPFESHSLVGKKVLVLAPHPDDETLGCGGSLIQHVRYGDPVKVLILTDGGAGYVPQKSDKDAYTSLREQEAQQACTLLGIEDLTCLGFPDRQLGKESHHFDKLKSLIASYQPELIYSTSPIDLNPDHRACANIVWCAIQELQLDTELVFYEISTPLPINLLVDISLEIELKTQAIKQYKSQMKQINYLDIAISMNRLRSLTIANQTQYAEGFVHFHSDEIFNNSITSFFNLNPLRIFKKKASPPAISIIVRTQNRPQLLREALQSLSEQTFKNFEVLLINDGEISLKSIVTQFKDQLRIKLFDAKEQGRSAAGNIGLTQCEGSFIGFLDDDDLLMPHHLQQLHDFLIQNEDIGLAYSDCQLKRFKKDYTVKKELIESHDLFLGIDYNRESFIRANYIPIMTVMFRKELLALTGLMDESMELFEDWDLWIRMSEHTKFQRIPNVSCEYRIFGKRNYNFLEGTIQVYKKYPEIYTIKRLTEWLFHIHSDNETLRTKLQKYEEIVSG